MKRERYILVAEDNVAMGNLLTYVLKDAGFTVTIARNGSDAWEAAQETQFDLIVTDHQMPGLTGLELCRLLRETERYADTPVIMITAKSLELAPQIREECQLTAIFSKPYSPKGLLRAVADCLDLAN